MDAGQLKERVIIQRRRQATEAGGQPVVTWTDLATVWARVAPESMTERRKRDKPTAVTRWTASIRYLADVDETCRIAHRDRTLDVTGVTYDRDRRWMYLDCVEDR